jgi:inosine/xanthosine triphosphate pyrophosphatase family protein
MYRLFLASRNAHKTRELAHILGPQFSLQDLGIHPEIGEVIEDGAYICRERANQGCGNLKEGAGTRFGG